jgi:hypothetical protein
MGSMNLETSASNNTSTGGDAAADDKDLPSIILMMRLLNMGAAGALIAISVRTPHRILEEHVRKDTGEFHVDRFSKMVLFSKHSL